MAFRRQWSQISPILRFGPWDPCAARHWLAWIFVAVRLATTHLQSAQTAQTHPSASVPQSRVSQPRQPPRCHQKRSTWLRRTKPETGQVRASRDDQFWADLSGSALRTAQTTQPAEGQCWTASRPRASPPSSRQSPLPSTPISLPSSLATSASGKLGDAYADIGAHNEPRTITVFFGIETSQACRTPQAVAKVFAVPSFRGGGD